MSRQASLESAGSSELGPGKAIHLEHGPSSASCRVEETTYQKPVEDAHGFANRLRPHVPDWRNKRPLANTGVGEERVKVRFALAVA
jgi:hypothetical protein